MDEAKAEETAAPLPLLLPPPLLLLLLLLPLGLAPFRVADS